jgi:hypothetical protein
LLFWGSFAARAAAEPAPRPELAEPVRAVYAAPGGCPDEAAFRAELAARLPGAAAAEADALARRLSVTIEQVGAEFRARVELTDSAGTQVSREVGAATCVQAMKAIALISALAARSQFEEERARAAPAEKTAKDPSLNTTPPGEDGAAGEPTPPPAPPDVRDGAPTERAPIPTRPSPSPNAHVELLGAFLLSTGVGPGLAPGIAVRAQLVRDAGGSVDWPFVALSARYLDSFRRDLPEAEVRFRQLSLRPELCAQGFVLSRGFGAGGCAGFEVGATFGEAFEDGTRVLAGRSASRFWAAGSVSLRGRLRHGAFAFEFGPELGIPLTRSEFALSGPPLALYAIPWATLGVGVAAGGGF